MKSTMSSRVRGSVLLESLFAIVIISVGVLAGFRAANSSMEQHSDALSFAKAGMAAMSSVQLMEGLVDRVSDLSYSAPSLGDFNTGNYVSDSCTMGNASLTESNSRQIIFFHYLRSIIEGFSAIKGSALNRIAVSVDTSTHIAKIRICWLEGNSRLSNLAGLVGRYDYATRINVLQEPEIAL